MNMEYDSVNFDDPISTQSYFRKLCRHLSGLSRLTGEDFDHLMKLIMTGTKKGSEKSVEIQAHHIMRAAAETIHDSFRELKRSSTETTAEFQRCVMSDTLSSLAVLPMNVILDVGVTKDYEVLG